MAARVAVAFVVAHLALALAASPVAADFPGSAVTVGPRNISLFNRYPDMQACEAAPVTNCYKFADGTVVGQVNLLAPLIPLLNFFRVPWGSCAKVPQLGASPFVVEVYAGAGVPLVVGSAACDALHAQLAAGAAYLVVPGVTKATAPTPAVVTELDVARP